MTRIATWFTLSLAALAASCQSAPQEVYRPVYGTAPATPAGVDGAWVDPNGIVSTFAGGTFTTRTTDTNQVLASGSYTNVTPQLVEINMTSMVRKTQSKVNCALATPSQLNCTTDSGSQFSLTRRS
ncbi:hypothetical protein BJF93_03055 [Xaviernesmea oryzae]|uniref:Outer membrane lipoprotein n=1 Tax=Xaviernesmea oryzae TaxID=464029 RepID=A0A1Q9AZD0_9HYPH|nr:outer membrane lipoprotein Omp10 [Xaviernesmea oryzae]OLP61051.1 hypothetical protein BJF93_03055 [Xaviernesmea oryzae]SEL15549.1 hypothetical protein SAMN04487976_10697 [Xaviernesmea oryzae]